MTMRPSGPRPKRPQSPTDTTKPPYTFIARTSEYILIECETLNAAVNQFVRYCIPPDPGDQAAFIKDTDGVIAIGYATKLGGEEFEWVGTETGYAHLASHKLMHPLLLVDVARGIGIKT